MQGWKEKNRNFFSNSTKEFFKGRAFLMKKRLITLVLGVVLIFSISPAMADTDAWYVEAVKGGEVELVPGTTTYCDKPFKIENQGMELAEVHVIMGNGSSTNWDHLQPKESKMYQLGMGEIKSPNAESHLVSEARIINSTAGTASIKVYCK